MALFQSGPRFNFDEEEARPKLFKPRFSIPANIEPLIRKAADESGVPFERLAATVKAESNFNPSARSGVGAIGLAQLMPGTAKELGVNPYDPEQNLRGGARYLKKQYDKFGDWDLAHGAYNAGPGRIKNGKLPNIPETQNYVKKIGGLLAPEEGEAQGPSIPSPAYPNQPLAERLKAGDATGASPAIPPEKMNAVMGEALAGANKKESFGKKFARALGFGSDSPEYDEYGIEKPKPKGGGVSNILGILLPTLVSMFGGAGAFPGLAAGYFGQRAGRAKQYNDDVDRYEEARKAKMKSMEPPEKPSDQRVFEWYNSLPAEQQSAFTKMKAESNPYAAANLQMRQDDREYQHDRDAKEDAWRLKKDTLDEENRKITADKTAREASDSLRNEYFKNPIVKDTQDATIGIKKIREAANSFNTKGSGFDDMSLIFNFMKVLDPGSTVREGEYATAAKNASLLQQIGVSWEKVKSGQQLSPEQRKNLLSAAERQYKATLDTHDAYKNQFTGLAKKRNVDPTDIFLDFGQGQPQPSAAPTSQNTSPESSLNLDREYSVEELMEMKKRRGR